MRGYRSKISMTLRTASTTRHAKTLFDRSHHRTAVPRGFFPGGGARAHGSMPARLSTRARSPGGAGSTKCFPEKEIRYLDRAELMSNWATPPGTIELRHDEIHLWRADLDRSLYLLPALMGTLPSEERRKASGSRSSLDRDRHILRRAILRSILARYLKTSPRDLEFRDGPRGTLRLT